MIYHVTFSGLDTTTYVNSWNAHTDSLKARIGKTITPEEKHRELAKFIKESSNDSFIFILVKRAGYEQWDKFPKWLKDHGLEHLVVKETKGITNPVHHTNQHDLKIVVLQSEDHFQREEYVK